MSVLTVTLVAQSLLGDRSHRLLSAAQAAKMAVVYSQYTSLYVLTNVVSLTEDFFSHTLSRDVSKQTKTSSSPRLLKAPACYRTVSLWSVP